MKRLLYSGVKYNFFVAINTIFSFFSVSYIEKKTLIKLQVVINSDTKHTVNQLEWPKYTGYRYNH